MWTSRERASWWVDVAAMVVVYLAYTFFFLLSCHFYQFSDQKLSGHVRVTDSVREKQVI